MKKDFSNLLGGAIVNKKSDELSIRDRIVIRDDFKVLIPPLAADELEQLEVNILKEGVRDPLIIWPVGDSFILVDGHNRFSVCQKHGLDFPFKQVEFKDDEDVRDWMIKNQLGRRNLSPEQQSYLRGLRYNREKAQGKRSDLTLDQNDLKSNSESTAALLGKEYNVSEATIKRDGEFTAGLDFIASENPALKAEVLKGSSKLSKQEIRSKAKRLGKKVKSNSLKTKKPKLDTIEVGRIAFAYLKEETRSLEEVCASLGFESNSPDPSQFFFKWESSKSIQ
jgi:ParB-like chromosome segregation protein Spo0J